MADVYTARVSYRGPDRLDVTRKSAGADGLPFAPSWALLSPYLAIRKARPVTDEDWSRYVDGYTAEMRASYLRHRAAWDDLLSRPRVVLVCYCGDPRRCHRRLLADILAKLGATDLGELAGEVCRG